MAVRFLRSGKVGFAAESRGIFWDKTHAIQWSLDGASHIRREEGVVLCQRAAVTATCARKPRCPARGGPQHRGKQAKWEEEPSRVDRLLPPHPNYRRDASQVSENLAYHEGGLA